MLYNLAECKKFDFLRVAAGQSVAIQLGYVDTSSIRSAANAVRVHVANVGGAGALIKVKAYRAWPSPSQPDVLFYDPTEISTATVTIDVAYDATLGAYIGKQFTDIAAPMVLFMVEGTQPGGGAVALDCIISVACIV